MNLKRLLLQALGVVLIVFILSKVDLGKTLQYIGSADLFVLSAAVLLIVLAASVVKVARWYLLLKVWKIKTKRREIVQMTLAANGIGLITPAKAGDFLRAFWIAKAEKMKLGAALATVFVDRVSDVIALLCFGALGLFMAARLLTTHQGFVWSAAISLAAIAMLIVLSMQEKMVKFLSAGFIRVLVPKNMAKKSETLIHDFYEALKNKNMRGSLFIVAVLTAISWVCILGSDFLIARALGLPVGFEFILIVMPLVFVVELLPISIAGLGTREASLIVVFSFIGVGSSQALAFGFMLFIFNTVQTIAGLLLYTAKRYPLS